MTICGNGHANDATSMFCTTCGLTLASAATPPQVSAPPAGPGALPDYTAATPMAANPKRSRGPLIAGIAAGAVLVVVLIVVFTVVIPRANRVSVPMLAGMSASAAQAALEDQGLSLGATRRANDSEVPKGDIISQSPDSGVEVAKGSTVSITVSEGPELQTFTFTSDESQSVIDAFPVKCSTWLTVYETVYGQPEIWDRSGTVLSRIEGSWEREPDNGNFVPCKTTAVFPDIPVNAGEFRVVLDPDKAEDNYVGWWTPSELEAQDWKAEE